VEVLKWLEELKCVEEVEDVESAREPVQVEKSEEAEMA